MEERVMSRTTVREMAMRAYRQRQQEQDDAEAERQLRAILAAYGAAQRRFKVEPERFFWCNSLRCPVVSFDNGDVELARTRDGEWHVIHRCESCGAEIHGGAVVRDLAEVGRELEEGPDCDDFEGHYCAPRREAGQRLSDYLGESAA